MWSVVCGVGFCCLVWLLVGRMEVGSLSLYVKTCPVSKEVTSRPQASVSLPPCRLLAFLVLNVSATSSVVGPVCGAKDGTTSPLSSPC